MSRALLCVLSALAVTLAPGTAARAHADGVPLSLKGSFVSDASLVSGPPVSIGAPVVGGVLMRGQTLTVNSGSWNPSATTVAYQWQTDSGSGFADITGATATTYTLVAGDIGNAFRVTVTGTNASGSGVVTSNAVGPVIDAVPVNTTVPVISGNLQGGKTLTASAGTWYPAGTSYAYQWQRDTGSGFASIVGATGPSYTTVPADVTAHLRLRVAATNPYGSTSAVSASIGPITSGAPVNATIPAIAGTAKRGVPLAATAGSWSTPGTTYAYQWQIDDGSGGGFADITGANTTSYTPLAGDVGSTLQVVVTATNAFGSTVATSAATGAVATDPPVNVGSPSIAGTAKRTFTLTAAAGTWTPAGAVLTYQWQRDSGSGFADISGATAPSYSLVLADVGATVRVQVTATNGDGAATAPSAPTAVVAAASPGSTTAPVISGGTRVGDTITTNDGSWNPAAVSYAYQWQRRVAGVYTDVSGATARTYTLAAADAGLVVRAKVTATNADGSSSAYSGASSTVVSPPVPPATIAAPSGTLLDGSTLTIDPGTWSPAGTTFTYQWVRCPAGATVIGGCITLATGMTYTLVGGDVGHTIGVRVTGTAGGVSTPLSSALTADVAGRSLTLVSAPTISGTVQVMQTIRAVPAVWTVPTQSEKFQWQRCDADGTNCADIPGAATQTYKVVLADAGHALVVRENAGSWGQTSNAASVASVVVDQPVPTIGTLPVITGSALRTANLQVSRGTWANDATAFAYAWQRCDSLGASCTPIAGATRTSYVLAPADVGHTITVAVTASNTNGGTTVSTAPTAVVAPVVPVLATIGAITGKLQVPQTIQVMRSLWHTSVETKYSYQWQRCDSAGGSCVDIAGARAQSYRLQTADARARLRVVTTATNSDATVTATTAPTVAILPAPPGKQITPRLTGVGRADVGKTLTLTPGTWNPATEIVTKVLEFWRCNPRCAVLATGGAGTYVLTEADAGALIRGSETATGPGGTTVAWAAAWLGPVKSASSGFTSLSALSSATISTSGGVALARVAVGAAKAAAVASAAPAYAAGAVARDRTVRITLRRAASAPKGRLRAWACVASPSSSDRSAPCTAAVSLRSRATLKLAVAKGQRVRVVVVRARHT